MKGLKALIQILNSKKVHVDLFEYNVIILCVLTESSPIRTEVILNPTSGPTWMSSSTFKLYTTGNFYQLLCFHQIYHMIQHWQKYFLNNVESCDIFDENK